MTKEDIEKMAEEQATITLGDYTVINPNEYDAFIAGANAMLPEMERLKKLIYGKRYWIWKGSDTDLDFIEWESNFKKENNL